MTQIKSRIGSSKEMAPAGLHGVLLQKDRGTMSVFDIGTVDGFQDDDLAGARTTQAAMIFEYLNLKGINSHYLDRASYTSLRVCESHVQDLPLLSGASSLRMFGLELLFRTGASEKFCKRVEEGDVEFDASKHLKKGQKLQPGVTFTQPFVEASTKWDDIDGYLKPDQAAELSGLSRADLDRLYRWVGGIGQLLAELFTALGYDLVDGKVEVARHIETGEFTLIDGISLDELGVVRDGEHFGKNLPRNWYKSEYPDWYAELELAQEQFSDDKSQWPKCPPLGQHVGQVYVARYVLVAGKLQEYVAAMLEAA